MTAVEIKQLQGDEKWDVLHALTLYAFQASPPLMEKDEWIEKAKDRQQDIIWGLFEHGEPVACAAESVMKQGIRGRTFSMSGIWGVATHPEARRRGYAKELLQQTLSFARENGRAVSCLYPFRESFYERLGYATFPHPKKAIFETQALAPVLNLNLDGTVEMVSIKEGYDLYEDFLTRYHPRVHGMALSTSGHRHRAAENESWLALAKREGRVIGLMVYSLEGEIITQFKMKVKQFYYLDSLGKYLLLHWIARHIDQAKEVELWLAPDERPETWLADLKLTIRQLHIPPMGRVLDVKKLEGMNVGPGRFLVHIKDAYCPWNEGVWRFESEAGSLQVSPASGPDFSLTINGLSALIYGTHRLEDFMYRNWGSPSPSQVKTLQAMFPIKSPYLHEFF